MTERVVIFDVDGTLIGSEQMDWDCFSDAIYETTGFRTHSAFWDSVEEVTSTAIVERIAQDRGIVDTESLVRDTCKRFGDNLARAIRAYPNAFRPMPGVEELLRFLRSSESYRVGLATGEWRGPIERKLACSKLEVTGIPLVTSSEEKVRSEAIRASVNLTGGVLANSVYVGDGAWDVRAARDLGVAFVGVGGKVERLRKAGAANVLEQGISPASFELALESAFMEVA